MTTFTVKVNRAKLSACFSCLLCDHLFTDATTISECLHTFCRECIDTKLIEEKLTHCPVCNADLGCSPLDKLRIDRSLQVLRAKIFPSEGQNAKTPGNVPSVTLLTKRKKKSPSPLKAKAKIAKTTAIKVFTTIESDFSPSEPDNVADVKKDEAHIDIEVLEERSTILSARSAKAAARRKFLRTEPTLTCQPDKVTGEGKKDDDHPQLKTCIKTSKTRAQNSSKPNSSQQIVPNKISRDSAELWKEMANMNEPLNCLEGAASTNKSCNKSTSTNQENVVIPVLNDNDAQVQVDKRCHMIKVAGDQNGLTPSQSNAVKNQRLQSTQEKSLKFSGDLNFPAQPVIGSSSEHNRGSSPIWFSLVASQEKEIEAQLPQIRSRYLRVLDGSLPVAFIKKYLAKKLNLGGEAEVEISIRGLPVLSNSLQLKSLADLWLQTAPTNEIQTSVGSSAKDFVMILTYCRKT
ncbi:hypothetical protein RJT34_23427 [Clitoria ternatea]|uniref:RING-type domain-containing protein n=1 Tax=Clitoria ternatea TaxID=43366 RepID=A0AAN9FL39_CLITE